MSVRYQAPNIARFYEEVPTFVTPQELESFTTSKTDRHLLRQKVRQIISVIKTNTFDDIKEIVYFGIFIYVLS